jgi:hypothetical protein
MFTMTFDLHLELLTPYFTATTLMADDKMSALDTIEPATFA